MDIDTKSFSHSSDFFLDVATFQTLVQAIKRARAKSAQQQ